MIPDDEVDRVLDASDIVSLIGETIRLKRVGNSWRGPCPFHQGKGDNFSVMPGRGYRCWVCGETGSIFTFVQKQLGMDFVEAVKHVGLKSGIEVRETARRTEGPDPREPLWEAVAATAEFFQKMLWEDAEGSRARAYLAKREISEEVARRFSLGYSPIAAGALRAHLDSLGVPTERQVDAGVLKRRDGETQPVPRFRGRLMFPIHDAQGRAVGFGGRSLDGTEPKYINSAESAVYSKGTLLYHLHEARFAIRKAERALLVEGYFDVVRTAAAGIDEVVAPLGTALTHDQATLIKRYSPNIFLLYDSDKAGLKATFRAGDSLLHEGASVRVVTFPEGEDPDTFVAKFGAAGLEKQLSAAVDVFERKLQLLQRGGWFGNLTKVRSAVDKLLPTIRAATDPVTRDLYVSRAAQASGVDRETLLREAASMPGPADFDIAPKPRQEVRTKPSMRRTVQVPGLQAEMGLIRAMLASPSRVDEITEALGRIDDEAGAGEGGVRTALRDERLRAIHEALLHADGNSNVEQLSETLSPDAIALVEDLISQQDSIVRLEATIDDCLTALKVRWRRERIDALRVAGAQGDPDRLNAETLRLKKEIQELSRRPSSGVPD